MKIYEASDVTLDMPWKAVDLAAFRDATVRLHWTNEPYHWHVNSGPEVFVVLHGLVDMLVRDGAVVKVHALSPGKIAVIELGDEHVAHPRGEARVLVIEERGSD